MARDRTLDWTKMFGYGTLANPRKRRALLGKATGIRAEYLPGVQDPKLRFTGPAAGQGRTRTARRAQYLAGMLQGSVATITSPSSVKKLVAPAAFKAGYLRGAGRRSSKPKSGAGNRLVQFEKFDSFTYQRHHGGPDVHIPQHYIKHRAPPGTNKNPGKFWIQISNGRFAGSMTGAPKGGRGKGRRR